MPRAEKPKSPGAKRKFDWRIVVGAALFVAVAVTAVLVLRNRRTETPASLAAFPPPPATRGEAIRFEDYVGSESCAGCHATQFAAWSKSTHGRAGQAPPRDLVLRRFDGTPIRFRDATVEPRVSNGQYEFVVHWADRTDHYPIVGVVGAGHMIGGGTQGFLWRHPDGSLRLLPFEITRTDSTWFCSTGTRANRGWSRITSSTSIADCGDWPPIRVLGNSARFASCQECHGSQIEMNASARPNETRFASLSINCESCHGAGRKHVELMRAGAKNADIGMQALATKTRDESLLVCMRCHAVKSDVRRGYLSGQPVTNNYSLELALLGGDETHPDGRTKTFGYQQGHYYSDCYLSGSMTCVDCHEPHGQRYRNINGRALPGRFDDAQCTDCHASKAVQPELHTHHPAKSEGSRCVSCHMPFVQEAAVGSEIRYTRSDHTIGNPRPELDQQLGIANACRNCHTDRSTEQVAQDTRRWWGEPKPLRPIIAALVSATSNVDFEKIILAKDTTHRFAYFDALARYLSGLDKPDARSIPKAMQGRLWELTDSRNDDLAALALATLHFDAGSTSRVRDRLIAKLNALGARDAGVRRRWAIALGQRADALRAADRRQEALPAYGKALELLPEDADFLLAYGVTQLDAGDPVGSSETLRRAAVLDDRNSLIHINYGRARSAAGDETGALAAYRRATEVNPYDALAFFNLGNSFIRQDQRDSAAAAYRRATELDASLAPAQFNLARVLLMQGKNQDAIAYLRAGLIFDPNQPDAADALKQLEGETKSSVRK